MYTVEPENLHFISVYLHMADMTEFTLTSTFFKTHAGNCYLAQPIGSIPVFVYVIVTKKFQDLSDCNHQPLIPVCKTLFHSSD